MATKSKEQVIYSEITSTVHVKDGEAFPAEDGSLHQPTKSIILLPGETLPLDEVPSYMLQLVKENKAPGLILLDVAEAEKLNQLAKLARGEASISDFVSQEDTDSVEE